MRSDTTYRVFDEHQARKTLRNLERSVEEYRSTHRSDDGIKVRLTRIAVLRMELKNRVNREEEEA